ncbi:segregation/condensation protein A [Acidobacteria bacterium AH-259-A15]|nr:segregation/condensation protein A [Acidobacteria bacterium AH-259-A15]
MKSETFEQGYTIRLEIFEGPLDLLLHLIRQQEIDICDIPIAQITDQYLHYLEMMKDLNITIAGDFLVMAATLIYMKSCMLLPPDPHSEVEKGLEELRRELVEQLIEHERFKTAAQMLYERETVELSVWPRTNNEFEAEQKELVSASAFDLISAFHSMVERYKDQIILEIENDPVTIEEKMDEIRRFLKVQREFLFSLFFQRKLSRLHLAVTLFALLELVRLREIRLLQKGVFEDIRILAC